MKDNNEDLIMADAQTLQKLYILATGSAANTTTLNALDTLSANGYAQIDQRINTYLGAQEASIGSSGVIQAIARDALNLDISASQAAQVSADLDAAGLDTWSEVLHWVASTNSAMTTTLNNRADAAIYLRDKMLENGTSYFWDGAHSEAAINNVINAVGDTQASVTASRANLDWLADNIGPNGTITPGGINTPVVNGYLLSSLVYTDVNANGRRDEGEWTQMTDDNGFTLLPSGTAAGTLVATGGVDLFTGKPFMGVLTAPAGSTVVTPLTTLVQAFVEAGGSWVNATSAIETGLGLDLPAGVSLLNYDPLHYLTSTSASTQEKATAMAVMKASLQVSNIIAQLGNALDAGSGIGSAEAGRSVAQSLASVIHGRGTLGQSYDLGSSANMSGLINNHLSGSAWTSSVDSLASIMAASNLSISAAGNTMDLSKAAVVSQSLATNAIIAGVTGNTLSATATEYTGANLSAHIAMATPGLLAPGVPTTSASVSALSDGGDIGLVGVSDAGLVA